MDESLSSFHLTSRKNARLGSLEREKRGVLLEKKPGALCCLHHTSCHRRQTSMKRRTRNTQI
jgi:hypothetical protein